MSRTFRRKNWEKIVQPCGSKVNGFYTTYDKLVEYPSLNGGPLFFLPEHLMRLPDDPKEQALGKNELIVYF